MGRAISYAKKTNKSLALVRGSATIATSGNPAVSLKTKKHLSIMTTSPFALLAPIADTARTGARFASLTYTAKGTGEKARHTVALGVSVERAYKRDVAILEAMRPTLEGVKAQACDELLASLRESLTVGIGNNSAYTCADVYAPIARGIKVHKESGAVHVFGFGLQKSVIEKGEYKTVRSSEKTLAKNELRKRLKSGKFRQFVLSEVSEAKMNGKTLIFE